METFRVIKPKYFYTFEDIFPIKFSIINTKLSPLYIKEVEFILLKNNLFSYFSSKIKITKLNQIGN